MLFCMNVYDEAWSHMLQNNQIIATPLLQVYSSHCTADALYDCKRNDVIGCLHVGVLASRGYALFPCLFVSLQSLKNIVGPGCNLSETVDV